MVTVDALAITQLMIDLCSAPCKARRFAPPAPARGLRALTVPARRSRLGHYVMAGGVMVFTGPLQDRSLPIYTVPIFTVDGVADPA